MLRVKHKPSGRWCISYTTCAHSPCNVRCVFTGKTQYNPASRRVRTRKLESSFPIIETELGKGASHHVWFGGGTWLDGLLGQFLANFSVLSSCVESSQKPHPFMQPPANTRDLQLVAT